MEGVEWHEGIGRPARHRFALTTLTHAMINRVAAEPRVGKRRSRRHRHRKTMADGHTKCPGISVDHGLEVGGGHAKVLQFLINDDLGIHSVLFLGQAAANVDYSHLPTGARFRTRLAEQETQVRTAPVLCSLIVQALEAVW